MKSCQLNHTTGHEIGHHIENVLVELPHHLASEREFFYEKRVNTCLDEKDSKGGFDYRVTLLRTTAYVQQNKFLSETPLLILEIHLEVPQILYCEEEKRSPCFILRCHNQFWYYAILLKLRLKNPKKYKTQTVQAHADMIMLIISRSMNIYNHKVKGVDSRRSRMKHFFLSGISDDVHKDKLCRI